MRNALKSIRLLSLFSLLSILPSVAVPQVEAARSGSSGPLIAFLRNDNVWMAQADGQGAIQLTRDGTGNRALHGIQVSYAYLTWSPDRRHLLIGRFTSTNITGQPYRQSWGLRTWTIGSAAFAPLATSTNPQDFSPVWSENGHLVAYMTSSRYDDHTTLYRNTLVATDLSGHIHPLAQFTAHEGCLDSSTDPSELTFWNDVGPGGIRQTLTWSSARHFMIYSAECIHTGLTYRDLSTGKTHSVGRWMTEAALSPDGKRLAGVVHGHLVLENPDGTGQHVYRATSNVRLPIWSPDGHSLYLTFRTTLHNLTYHDQNGNLFEIQVNRAFIARLDLATNMITTLLTQPIHAYADLSPSADGRWLYATRVTNSDVLYQHLKNSPVITNDILNRYGPTTDIVRLPATGGQPQLVLKNALEIRVSGG